MVDSHREYRTNIRDYNSLIQIARMILKSGNRIKMEKEYEIGMGFGKITAGSSSPSRPSLNYLNIIAKTIRKIYEHEQRTGISVKEAEEWVANKRCEGIDDEELIKLYRKEIAPLFPRSEDRILMDTRDKFMEYFREKWDKIEHSKPQY